MNTVRHILERILRRPIAHPARELLAAALTAIALSGCVPNEALRSSSPLPERVNPSVVLLIKPDVQLSVMTASGLEEPNAEWTAAGQANVERALGQLMRERNASLIPYVEPQGDPDKLGRHNQLMKMHQAVGSTILVHKYNQALALPTKTERFDWTLGPGARQLRQESGADYALFVYLRDSYASAGRVAVIFVGALFGAAIPGGIQVGFASLVDLRNGEVVWFNRLVSGTGDLRTPEPARQAVDSLLTDLPL